jgi:hypothetical protein
MKPTWQLLVFGPFCVVALVFCFWGLWDDQKKDKEMRTIPYELTPNSQVRCYNKFGTLVFENKIVDRTVEHVLTRLPCYYYMSGGCCVSDPPKDGTEDSRKWGVGRTDSDVVIAVDGRNVECIVIKELNHG